MYKIKLASFDSLIIEFGEVSRDTLLIVRQNYETLKKFYEVVPSYNSILVRFGYKNYNEARKEIDSLLTSEIKEIDSEIKIIPAFYSLEVGPDLKRIAEINKISIKEVIKKHSSKIYDVYAIGFLPGFAYMGVVDILAPRLESPRKLVKKGSIGIAGIQTGVYPKDSPGGWNIVAKTYIEMFNNGSFLKVGDRVKFEPITREEFIKCGGVIESF
ncbi:allophanate hydrolase subunit 1 [Caminibacter profundus]